MAENQNLKRCVFLRVNSQIWYLFLCQGVLSQQRSWQSLPAVEVSEKESRYVVQPSNCC